MVKPGIYINVGKNEYFEITHVYPDHDVCLSPNHTYDHMRYSHIERQLKNGEFVLAKHFNFRTQLQEIVFTEGKNE